MQPRAPKVRISPRFDSLEQEAFLGLWRTYDRLRALEEALFAQYDLTPQQYNALRLLRAAPDGLPTLTLAARLVSRAPDITRLVDRLAALRLAARKRSQADRRQVAVEITPRGRDLLAKVEGPLRDCHERQLGHLSREELELLISLLERARAPYEPEGSPWS